MNDLTIGIKIDDRAITAQGIKVIRGILSLSISEIKERVATGAYLYVGDSAEDEVVDTIILLYEKLAKAHIKCNVYEFDELSDIEIIYNMRESYDEINRQIDDEET